MSIVNTFRCDVCGTLKKETNKWWGVYESQGYHEGRLNFRAVVVVPIEMMPEGIIAQHCCGRECVMKAVTEKMAEIE